MLSLGLPAIIDLGLGGVAALYLIALPLIRYWRRAGSVPVGPKSQSTRRPKKRSSRRMRRDGHSDAGR